MTQAGTIAEPEQVDSSPRSVISQVSIPREHGGWGLSIEPVLLGLLVDPSWAGLCLGLMAIAMFIARTPLKVVLVDLWRKRWLQRTRVAAIIFSIESLLILVLFIASVVLAKQTSFLIFIMISIPMVLVALYFDMKSKSRRLLPELAGSIGLASMVGSIVVSSGTDLKLAFGLWMVVSSRILASVPYVRAQMFRARKVACSLWHSDIAQLIAVSLVYIAWQQFFVPFMSFIVLSCVAIAHVVLVRGPILKLRVVGYEQMAIGLIVIFTTAIFI